MRDLFLALIFGSLVMLGFSSAFVAGLAYVWVDILKPKSFANGFLISIPLSLIAVAATFLLYILLDRKERPKFTLPILLLVCFYIWITINAFISPMGELAWEKWGWASKVVMFAVFIPFLFRSRIQIESFLLIFLFSVSTIVVSAGIKTALGGGGYGTLALLGGNTNSGLAEGSTVAAVSVMFIPIADYMRQHTLILVRNKYTNMLFLGIILASVLTVIGTSARTGLIALAILLIRYVLKTKKKFLWIFLILSCSIFIQSLDLESTRWGSRMSTIETYDKDSSAMGRIAVWKWTVGYVAQHPLGGGFDSFKLNRIKHVYGDYIEYYNDDVIWGKAFHSIYFEVLGEQGIPGFLMYFGMVAISWRKMTSIQKTFKNDKDMEWLCNLSRRVQDAMAILLVACSFIGIAYQPVILYLLASTISVDQYAMRYKRLNNLD